MAIQPEERGFERVALDGAYEQGGYKIGGVPCTREEGYAEKERLQRCCMFDITLEALLALLNCNDELVAGVLRAESNVLTLFLRADKNGKVHVLGQEFDVPIVAEGDVRPRICPQVTTHDVSA